MIIYFCHRCGKKGEFETKKEMKCDCGHYVEEQDRAKNHVNMRTTWSGTTKIEFSNTTMAEDITRRNNSG